MRPLFSEKVADMLMECASINVKPTEGWPDKICVQCLHSVSRCHAFKMLAERSDKELREYINSLTICVVIDEAANAVTKQEPSSILMDNENDESAGQQRATSASSPVAQTIQPMLQTALPQLQQNCRETHNTRTPRKQVKGSSKAATRHRQLEREAQQQTQHNQYSASGKRKVPISRKAPSLARKQQQEMNHSQSQLQQQQQQQQHQQQLQAQHQQTLAQQQLLQQQNVSLADPLSLQSTQRLQVPPTPPILTTSSQLLPLNANTASAPPTAVLPTVSAALPQQLLLPNGQIITTAQILTTTGGPPQLAHIITNPGPGPAPTPTPVPAAPVSQPPQFTPHLLQTTGGQTLQLIQQPNGQHVLQLVHLVPQRTANGGGGGGGNGGGSGTGTMMDNHHEHLTIMDEDTLIEQAEQHLIDDDDDDLDDVNVDVNHSSGQVSGGDRSMGEQTICDTIVVDDDQLQSLHHHQQQQQHSQQSQQQHHHQHHLLSQSDVHELEYLDDITVTTSTQQHHHHHHQQQARHSHLVLHEQQAQHLLTGAATVIHDVDDDDDIIEEIHIEEEMLDEDDDDDGADGGPVLMETGGSEFLADQDDHIVVNHQMIETANQEDDCDQDNIIEENEFETDENPTGTLTHYTVMTEDDNGALVEANVGTVLQVACAQDLQKSQLLRPGRHQSGGSGSAKQHGKGRQTSKGTPNNNTNSMTPENGGGGGVSNRSPASSGSGGSGSRKQKRGHNIAKALANSKQLAATATSIAAAGDDEFEVDTKLIAEFINQQTTIMNSGRYMCNLCRQEFRQLKGLQNHMHLHSNWIRANCRKLPQCEICHKSFKGPGMLKMHMKSHLSAAKVPTCQICGKSFKTKAILYRHRQTHQLRWYLCAAPNCRKGFSSPISLKTHIERKHPETNDVAKYKCGECLTIFYTMEELSEHIRITGHGSNTVAINAVSLSDGALEAISGELVGTTTVVFDRDQSNLLDNSIAVASAGRDNVDDGSGANGTLASGRSTSSVSTISNSMDLGASTVTMTEVVNSNGEVFIVTPA